MDGNSTRELWAYLPQAIAEEELRSALSAILRLPVGCLQPLEGETPTEASFGTTLRKTGFRLEVSVHVRNGIARHIVDNIDFGSALAKHFAQDALVDFPAIGATQQANPYLWLLVKPDGRMFQVSGDTADRSGDVVIDPSTTVPWHRGEPWRDRDR